MMAQMCEDEKMLDAANHGRDLYSEVAAAAFNTTYTECLEHFPVGTPIKKDDHDHWHKCTTKELLEKGEANLRRVTADKNNQLVLPFESYIRTDKGYMHATALDIGHVILGKEDDKFYNFEIIDVVKENREVTITLERRDADGV